MGLKWVVGMAFKAAQASACLPALYSLKRCGWQPAQVSAVTVFAPAPSSACYSPWHTLQVTPFSACLLASQSATVPGVRFLWHIRQSWAKATGDISIRVKNKKIYRYMNAPPVIAAGDQQIKK
jgi:hypothetical protein